MKGKKQYGYLPKCVKKQADEIVDQMARLSPVQKCYEKWSELSSLMFKHSVELDMVMGILADAYEFTPEDIRRRRMESVRNVKNTNGRLPFKENIRKPDDGVEDEWPD